MAQTNVQAFSGDVAISSNLAVDTNTLFVDSVGNKVGIGKTNPGSALDVVGDGAISSDLVVGRVIAIANSEDTGFSNVVALSIQAKSNLYSSITNGYGSRIQFRTNRGTSGGGVSASADIKGYIYSGAGGGADYHGLDIDVYGDNTSLGKGISILSTYGSGSPANTIMHGNVGIGTNTPLTKLHVKGSGIMIEDNSTNGGVVVENHAAGTGDTFSFILNAPRPGTTSGGATHFINAAGRSDDGGVSAYTIRNDSGALVIGGNTYGTTTINGSGNIIRANGNSSTMLFGPNANYSASLLVGATGGGAHVQTTAGLVVTNGNLHLDAGAGMITFVNHYSGSGFVFSASNTAVTSDDRVKTGEKFIENALTTLKKLKPQTYIQSRRLNDETSDCAFSAGLIAQEVYYQCPELKHIVKVPDTAHVDLTKEFPDDPQVDPDYSDWGDQAAAVGYIELIPYTISAIKQLSNEGTRHKVRVSNVSFSNVLEYHGLVVSKNSDVYVSNVENDKRVYGVISDVKAETNDNEFLVNYRGDGKVWVINADNIQAGDYITTSNVSGYAMKQEEDDTLKNYTVAKSTIDCDFTQPMIDEKRVVQTNTMTSRWKRQSNVEVLESTYSNISEDVRYTETKVLYETLNGDNKISQEEYDLLSLESQNNYTQTIMTKYFYKCTRYLEYNPRDSKWIEESFSKTVDSLDENGQLIWENTGTQVPLYPIKYITSSGTETNLSDAVYTAALIDCSILGG